MTSPLKFVFFCLYCAFVFLSLSDSSVHAQANVTNVTNATNMSATTSVTTFTTTIDSSTTATTLLTSLVTTLPTSSSITLFPSTTAAATLKTRTRTLAQLSTSLTTDTGGGGNTTTAMTTNVSDVASTTVDVNATTSLVSSSVTAPTTTARDTGPAATTLTAIAALTTTVAPANVQKGLPFLGFQFQIKPILNGSSSATAIAAATRALVASATSSTDSAAFLAAFRADLAALLDIPAADIAVDSIDVSPDDLSGQTIRIQFLAPLVLEKHLKQLLGHVRAATVTIVGGATQVTNNSLPLDWGALMATNLNALLPAASPLRVLTMDGVYASPDISITTAAPPVAADTNSACFVANDCAGTIMVIISVIAVIVCIALSFHQYWAIRKETREEEFQHEKFEKMAEERDKRKEAYDKAKESGAAAVAAATAPAAGGGAAARAIAELDHEMQQQPQPQHVLVQPMIQQPMINAQLVQPLVQHAQQPMPMQQQHQAMTPSAASQQNGYYDEDFLL